MSLILVFWAQQPLFWVNPFQRCFRVVANLFSPLSIFHSITVGHQGCPSWESVAILSSLWGWPWEPECSSASGSFATLAWWKGMPQWVERRKEAERAAVEEESSGQALRQSQSPGWGPIAPEESAQQERPQLGGKLEESRSKVMWPRRDSILWKQVFGDQSGHSVWMAIISKGFTADENVPVPTVTTAEQNIQKMRENRTSRSLSSNGNSGSWFLMTHPSLPTGSALLSGGLICGINDLCQCSIQTLIYLYASKWTSLLGWTRLVQITNPSANVQSHSCGTCSLSKEGKCIVIT